METKPQVKKKIIFILPVVLILVLALGFYHYKAGADKDIQKNNPGINTELPDASLTTAAPQDKFAYYQQSGLDSAKNQKEHGAILEYAMTRPAEDEKARQINQKLEQLTKEISKPEIIPFAKDSPKAPGQNAAMKNDVDRLEALMSAMQTDKAEDPEMKQLSNMLDKIITIQNPAIAQQKIAGQAYPDSVFKAIPAAIEGSQKIKQGGLVKLRLLDTIKIKGVTIPRNHLLFGLGTITNQRLLVTIKNIRLGQSIIPVDLAVYAMDGILGLDAPEAELGEVAGNGASDALQGMQFLSMDQSVGVQAAGAGIYAAKTLFSKKVRRIRVKLNAGTAVLLRDNQLNIR